MDQRGIVSTQDIVKAFENEAVKIEVKTIIQKHKSLRPLLDLQTYTDALSQIAASTNEITLSDLKSYIKKSNDMLAMAKVTGDISTVFDKAGPLGIVLAQRKQGGAIIKNIMNRGLAKNNKNIRKSMVLKSVNGVVVLHQDLPSILELLQSACRPLTLIWKSSPSRSISPNAREIRRKNEEAEILLQDFFQSIDTDSSGTITKKELLKGITLQNQLFAEIVHLYPQSAHPLLRAKSYAATFEAMDIDHSGNISLEELKMFMKGLADPPPKFRETFATNVLKKFFDSVDEDSSGTITKSELLKALQQTNVFTDIVHVYPNLKPLTKGKTYKATFDKIDADHSGGITFRELLSFVNNTHDSINKSMNDICRDEEKLEKRLVLQQAIRKSRFTRRASERSVSREKRLRQLLPVGLLNGEVDEESKELAGVAIVKDILLPNK